MPKDTITLALNGDVSLSDFADVIFHFRLLVDALSSEEAGSAGNINWIIHDLQVGSAVSTIRGESESVESVERAVAAYGRLGQQLESGSHLDFPERVVKEAEAITHVLNGGVTSIRFETSDIDATISSRPTAATGRSTRRSLGAVEGRIQTLTNRKGLRFNLYDALHDKAVACYLQEGQEDMIRELWGKRVIVEGEVTREIISGRTVAIRRISNIRALPEAIKGGYLRARNISPRKSGTPLPEQLIRKLRDA